MLRAARALASFALLLVPALSAQPAPPPDSARAALDSVNTSFTYARGTLLLGHGVATIEVPEGFKYLDAEQSKTVLEDLWGNPPSETWGLLFPEAYGPLDSAS